MKKPAVRAKSFRSISFLLLIAVVLSACSGALDDPNQGLTKISGDAPVLPSMMAGYTQNQLDAYARWFRSSDSGTPPAVNPSDVRYLNPSCPLELDYTRMLPNGSGMVFPDVRENTGYYNPAKQEMLVVLRGQGFGYAETASGGLSCGKELYLPLRASLGTGSWQIDGFSTPGSTIQIAVTGSHEIVPLSGDGDLGEDTTEMVSPLRLMRFRVTDENFERVMRYASVSRRSGAARHIAWFNVNDINPVYARMASGNCTPGYYAFWSSGGDDKMTPCATGLDFGEGDDNPHWLDEFARMNGSGGKVWEKSDDDRCGLLDGDTAAGTCELGNDGWKQVAQHLTSLVSGGNRTSSFAALHSLLEENGALAENAIPDEFGGWENPDEGLFGVIVANGRTSYDQTRKELNDDATLHKWVGFTGKAGGCDYDPCGANYSITITSSFQFTEVETDEDAAAVYNATSLINGGRMRIQPFSSADAAATSGDQTGLAYQQSPLAKIEINVIDPLNAGHSNTYRTEWLPLWAMGRNAGDMKYQTTMDWLGDPLGSMSAMVYEMFYQIYRATFGNWVSGLSQAATSWLVSVPQLEEYAIAYYDAAGNPVHEVKKDLIRADLVTRKSGSGPALENEAIYDTSKLSGDTKTCTEAALFGSLDVNNPALDPCFERNRLFDLWFWLRGLAWIFLLGHIFFYGYRLLTLRSSGSGGRKLNLPGKDRSSLPMTPPQFAARVAISFGLIEGMSIILFVLQAVVGEVLIMTNLIGTRVGGGEPYSHLWLFNTFLTTPPRGADVLGLFILSIPTLIGLVVLLMVGWLRYGITLLLLLLTPFWALWLLGERSPQRFYSSLSLMVRLYLMPLLTLVLLLMLFVSMRLLGIGPGQSGGLVGALLSFLMLIAVAIVPFLLSKMVFRGVTDWVANGIASATKTETSQIRETLAAGGDEASGPALVTDRGPEGMGSLAADYANPGASTGGRLDTSANGVDTGSDAGSVEGASAADRGGAAPGLGEAGDKLFKDPSKAGLRGKLAGARGAVRGALSKDGLKSGARRAGMAAFAGSKWTVGKATGLDVSGLSTDQFTVGGAASALGKKATAKSVRSALTEAVAISGVNHAWAAQPPWMTNKRAADGTFTGASRIAAAGNWAEDAAGRLGGKINGIQDHARRFGALTDTWQSDDAEAVELAQRAVDAEAERERIAAQIGALNIDDADMRAMEARIRELSAEEQRINVELTGPEAERMDPEQRSEKQGRLQELAMERNTAQESLARTEEALAPQLKARSKLAGELARAERAATEAKERAEAKQIAAAASYAALRTMRAATPLMSARSAGLLGGGAAREKFGADLAAAAERMAEAAVAEQNSRQEFATNLINDGSSMAQEIERQIMTIESQMRSAPAADRASFEPQLEEQRALAAVLTEELRQFSEEAQRKGVQFDDARLGETLLRTETHVDPNLSSEVIARARERLESDEAMRQTTEAKAAMLRAEQQRAETARRVSELQSTSHIRSGSAVRARGHAGFKAAKTQHLEALRERANQHQAEERVSAQRVEALRAQVSAAGSADFDPKLRGVLSERLTAAERHLADVRGKLESSANEAERVSWQDAASW